MSPDPDPRPEDEPLTPSSEHAGAPRGTARTLLLVAGAVVAAQAAALLTLAALELASVEGDRAGLGVSTTVFLAAFGLLLVFAVVRILGGHAWARGLLVFSQLLCLALSFNFRGDAGWITPTMAGAAVVALGCLLSPPVTQALGGPDPV